MTQLAASPVVSWIVARFGWIVAAIAIALGSAGLVSALDHRPGTGARAELTWSADQAVRGPLESIVHDLDPIALDFDALGGQGRAAIAALVASDSAALDAAIGTGQTLVEKIGVETTSIRSRLAVLPGTRPGAEGRLSADLIVRLATINHTLDSTEGIAQAWATLSSGAVSATRLAVLLSQHDKFSGEAVRQGSQGNYLAAVKSLDSSDPVLAEARSLRDNLANTADTTTLTQWLDRNGAIDMALRHLYTVLAVTGGKVTAETRAAFDEVKAAQAQLPPDTRALVVIMADIARAGLNQAVIKIEEARGKLADAIIELSRQAPGASGSPAPGEPPAASPGGSAAPGSSARPELTPPDA